MKLWSNWQIYSTSLSWLVRFVLHWKLVSVFCPNGWVFVYKLSGCGFESCCSHLKLDYNNYCPITLLSDIEKILEKLMYKRLYTFLNKSNVIYNLQFGFRQQYSTSHGLINVIENIRKALDDGNIGWGVFVDLQKAFDTIDHKILLAKLNHYGIHEVSYDWFKSYLSNHSL